MGLVNEILMVIVVALVLTTIGTTNFPLWSFLLAFIFAWVFSALIARKFAGGQKTMGSHGRYEKTSTVYLYFMIGIIVASYLGSLITNYLVGSVSPKDSTQIFIFSLAASLFGYFLVKIGFY